MSESDKDRWAERVIRWAACEGVAVTTSRELTVAEAAAALDVREETILRWCRSGRLVGHLDDGARMVGKDSVVQMLRCSQQVYEARMAVANDELCRIERALEKLGFEENDE